jgi:hypothetical protein
MDDQQKELTNMKQTDILGIQDQSTGMFFMIMGQVNVQAVQGIFASFISESGDAFLLVEV